MGSTGEQSPFIATATPGLIDSSGDKTIMWDYTVLIHETNSSAFKMLLNTLLCTPPLPKKITYISHSGEVGLLPMLIFQF